MTMQSKHAEVQKRTLAGCQELALASRVGVGYLLRFVVPFILALVFVSGCGLQGEEGNAVPEQAINEEMETFLQAHLATGEFMGSVLVARGKKVVHIGGYGMANMEHNVPNTPDTVFRLASLTKSFTAAAILQLQEQGRLDVNDPLAFYLPDYPHGDEITIYQLLNHTSGIPDYEFLQPSMAFRNAVSLEELVALFSGLPLEFPPGGQFKYSNSGYVILTAIIETVSGQSYPDYLAEHIFRPLGMDATGFEDAAEILPGRAAGYTRGGAAYYNSEFFDMSNAAGAGGLVSTVLDMYRWDRSLYRNDVLGEISRRAFFTPTSEMGEGILYTYGGGAIEISGRDYILFSGEINGFFTTALRYPEELYVVVLSNLENPSAQAVALGLAAIALGDPYEIPGKKTAVKVDPAIYDKYVGSYQVTPDIVITVMNEDGHLFVQAPDQPKFEVFPESETEFFADVAGTSIQLQFQVGTDGKVTGMTVFQGDQEIQAKKVE